MNRGRRIWDRLAKENIAGTSARTHIPSSTLRPDTLHAHALVVLPPNNSSITSHFVLSTLQTLQTPSPLPTSSSFPSPNFKPSLPPLSPSSPNLTPPKLQIQQTLSCAPNHGPHTLTPSSTLSSTQLAPSSAHRPFAQSVQAAVGWVRVHHHHNLISYSSPFCHLKILCDRCTICKERVMGGHKATPEPSPVVAAATWRRCRSRRR